MSSVPPTSPLGGPQSPLATNQAAGVAPVAATPSQAAGAVQPLLLRAVEAAQADAAVRQSGMGGLLADVEPALASRTLPTAIKAAVQQLVRFGLPAGAPPDAAALKAAVARSGLFLEAQLAQTPNTPPRDMKAALLILQQALVAAGAAGGLRATKAPSPPPTRGGAVAPQAARVALLRTGDSPEYQLAALREETEQALARQTLHQLASLPDETGGARWMFELPVATAHGAAVAQFAIERDPPEDAGGAERPVATWRARFALDIPPLGPVHAHLRLKGGRCGAVLWVEEAGSFAWLQGRADGLAATLGGEVTIRPGPPPAPPPPPGRLVDRTS
ncbi:MAG: flagellar hook-length control protein FliK [Phenylobacterium sp.]|uniref:flagellar hook-length control protein FliK n=1 Tax=Phenylobacterium sp. TaxID=1871053 RepID=UPI001A608380|nr:flagellar hook-length control protein FliK [Phenylobacterium sp.]MBL8555463.1 flagellar hook-length control protein FliK [Phenylobacterium sp.]